MSSKHCFNSLIGLALQPMFSLEDWRGIWILYTIVHPASLMWLKKWFFTVRVISLGQIYHLFMTDPSKQRVSIYWIEICSQRSRLPSHVLTSAQSVAICRLGCQGFNTFIAAIKAITDVFQCFNANHSVIGLDNVKDRSHPILVFSNHYYSQHEDTDTLMPVPFPQDVDLYEILSNVEEGIHTSDNEVQYFERIVKGDK